MQSKNKRAPRVGERAHIERLAGMRCVVCDSSGPCEVHEIKQGQWFTSIPLCTSCHRDPHNGIHGEKRMWAVMKMNEIDALAVTVERLLA
jgi:hypothetical protein